MQKRINKVLVICSKYDFFMLEEDGRIDEQIFNEYVSLNLRYPPVFIHADNAKDALALIEKEDINLIIPMLSIRKVDTFQWARQLKDKYPEIPIVLLTHFSRDVSIRMEKEDLSAIDYIFSWLGNSDIFLAIIKMIEDKMNAPHDILKGGVQAILLVEDSVRYVSSYLPSLYKIVLEQSKNFAREALNEHQQMLRRRGRPKILLAKTFTEAKNIYLKYEENILGIISDVSYKTTAARRDTKKKSGLKLCEFVKDRKKNLPFLLQSSDKDNQVFANQHEAGFLYKYSPNLLSELNDYIVNYFGFGDFIFRLPNTNEEIARADDLKSFHGCLKQIPDEVLYHHAANDDISKWLNARALFDIAILFKNKHVDDFDSLNDAREYIVNAIDMFRQEKGKGIITRFNVRTYDRYQQFSRIGNGSLGGKARGLAFMNTVFENEDISEKYPQFLVRIPSTVVLATDIFEEFLETNQLGRDSLLEHSDKDILQMFLNASLPNSLVKDIQTLAMRFNQPVAIRSSSKLEDSYYQPFAGIYKTYMIPVCNDKSLMATMIEQGIKAVYASVFYKNSVAYLHATSNVLDEEKMGVIIQEVCGSNHKGYFFPAVSGVARSVNYYPIESEKPDRGIVNMAVGLGKFIVDGHTSLRFSPDYPRKILQFSSTNMALRSTQKSFFALKLSTDIFQPSVNDAQNLVELPITELNEYTPAQQLLSSYDSFDDLIRDSYMPGSQPIVSFAGLLKNKRLHFNDLLNSVLEISQHAINNAVEIEFALDIKLHKEVPYEFNYLQVRPIVAHTKENVVIKQEIVNEALIYSSKALGNGSYSDTFDIVFVDTVEYSSGEMQVIKNELGIINKQFLDKGQGYVLVGPGRWGSSDPRLGIPVEWQHISAAKVIVEVSTQFYNTQPSQGTHFFHNLTNMGMGYLFIDSKESFGFIKKERILKNKTKSTGGISICHLTSPLRILFNGGEQKGVIQ